MTVRIDSAASPLAAGLDAGASAPAPPPPFSLRPLHTLEGLTPERRAEAHAANVAIRKGDRDRYAAYLEAFVERFSRCRTPAEAEAFGKLPNPPTELPPDATQAERDELTNGWRTYDADATHLTRLASLKTTAHRTRLAGGREPFSIDGSGSASAYVTTEKGRRYGVAVAASTDGPITGDVFVGTQRTRSTLSGTPGAAGAPAREYALGPVTITQRDGQPDRLEIDPMPLSPFGFTVATDRQSVTVCARAGKTLKRGDDGPGLTLEAKLCGTLHLTSPGHFDAVVDAQHHRPRRSRD